MVRSFIVFYYLSENNLMTVSQLVELAYSCRINAHNTGMGKIATGYTESRHVNDFIGCTPSVLVWVTISYCSRVSSKDHLAKTQQLGQGVL